jgi:hypothetical protein
MCLAVTFIIPSAELYVIPVPADTAFLARPFVKYRFEEPSSISSVSSALIAFVIALFLFVTSVEIAELIALFLSVTSVEIAESVYPFAADSAASAALSAYVFVAIVLSTDTTPVVLS